GGIRSPPLELGDGSGVTGRRQLAPEVEPHPQGREAEGRAFGGCECRLQGCNAGRRVSLGEGAHVQAEQIVEHLAYTESVPAAERVPRLLLLADSDERLGREQQQLGGASL